MFTVPAAIRRGGGVAPPIFTGPVTIPDVAINSAFSHDMSQYFTGTVDSYALTNDGGQAWLSINTSTGELFGTTPATPVSITGVIVTATNTGGSTPTDAFGFEVVSVATNDDFVSELTVGASELIELNHPGTAADYNYVVDWGDGNQDTITAGVGNNSHTYTNAGTYEVTVTGQFPVMQFEFSANKDAITRVLNLGDTGLTTLEKAFDNCNGLTHFTAGDANMTNVTSMFETFRDTSGMVNVDITGLDTSNVTTMEAMCRGSALTSFTHGSNDFSSLTTIKNMFNASDLVSIDWTGASFPNEVSLNSTFTACSDLTSVIGLTAFSGGIESLNLAFNLCSSLATLSGHENWNTSGTGSFYRCFRGCGLLNPDVSNWSIAGLTNAGEMFINSGFGNANYDALLLGWSAQTPNINNGTNFHAGSAQYTETAARDVLAVTHSWNIVDGGPA